MGKKDEIELADTARGDGGEPTEVNNSLGKPYYTQRNNTIKPGSACNVTSMIAALSAAGWPVEGFAPDGGQPEDALMRFIMTDSVTLNRWKQVDPKGEIPPNEWHPVLAFGTNRWLRTFAIESAPVTFHETARREDIIAAVDAKGAAVISGRFPREGAKPLDHVVAVVGYGNEAGVFYFIIDDPWGDYHTGYTSHNGRNIRLPEADFYALVKPLGQERKWAHIIRSFDQ